MMPSSLAHLDRREAAQVADALEAAPRGLTRFRLATIATAPLPPYRRAPVAAAIREDLLGRTREMLADALRY